MKSGAISCWTEEDQLQIQSSHSVSANNHLHYLFYNVIKGNVNILSLNFHFYCLVCDWPGLATMKHNLIMSRQNDVATWFVAYWYKKYMSIIERFISIHISIFIYWEFLASFFLQSLMLYIEIYWVGNDRTMMSLHISDQLGRENAC